MLHQPIHMQTCLLQYNQMKSPMGWLNYDASHYFLTQFLYRYFLERSNSAKITMTRAREMFPIQVCLGNVPMLANTTFNMHVSNLLIETLALLWLKCS